MAQQFQFKKAVKTEAKGRVALIGPAGSGKSYTMLVLARTLVGPTGKIAAIDSEHGSLSKYADLFEFDVIELDSFHPTNFLAALKAAEDAGYHAFCCDSLSHFWVGKDGAMEFVDNALTVARARSRNGKADDMAGWKEFAPHERRMVDAMIASPCHVIVTMRVKTAYEEQVGSDGKKRRVKVGLAPVQRAGLEYEFDLVAAMDEDNNMVVDKSRVMLPDGSAPFTGKAIPKPGPAEFAPFIEWLKGSPRPAQLEAMLNSMKDRQTIEAAFGRLQNEIAMKITTVAGADSFYVRVLNQVGFKSQSDMKTLGDARKFARALWEAIQTIPAASQSRSTTPHGDGSDTPIDGPLSASAPQVPNRTVTAGQIAAAANGSQGSQAQSDDPALATILKGMTNQTSMENALAEILEAMGQKIGAEAASDTFNRILGENGLEVITDIKSLVVGKTLAKALWASLKRMPDPPPASEQAPSDGGTFKATDEDLPQGLFDQRGAA